MFGPSSHPKELSFQKQSSTSFRICILCAKQYCEILLQTTAISLYKVNIIVFFHQSTCTNPLKILTLDPKIIQYLASKKSTDVICTTIQGSLPGMKCDMIIGKLKKLALGVKEFLVKEFIKALIKFILHHHEQISPWSLETIQLGRNKLGPLYHMKEFLWVEISFKIPLPLRSCLLFRSSWRIYIIHVWNGR